jgi:hypothetical protein
MSAATRCPYRATSREGRAWHEGWQAGFADCERAIDEVHRRMSLPEKEARP